MLILPLFFFSCFRQGSNSETTKISIESAEIEPFKKDSIVIPSLQDVQIKDILMVEGSVQKAFDTLSLDFNISGKKVIISSLRIFDIPVSDFISDITGKGSRIGIHGDTLSIGHGAINEHYSFPSMFHVVAHSDSSYLIKSLPPGYRQKRREDYHTHIASVSEKLRLVKKGEHKELFHISNADTIQISDIKSFYKEHYSDREYEIETDIMFDRTLFETVEFSPDGSKILYSYPSVMHDFVHGPMYLVNVNGDKLKMLSIDGGFSREQRPAWLADGNNVIFHRFAKDDSSGLYMTINSENDFIRIAVEVDQFEIKPGAAWD